jgi:hypothetical protein
VNHGGEKRRRPSKPYLKEQRDMKHLKDDELDVHRPKEASIEAKKNDKVSSKPHTSFNEKNDDTN